MKKLIITLLATGILLLSSSSVFAWTVTHIPTDVGVVPAECGFGYLVYPDTFYKDFTK